MAFCVRRRYWIAVTVLAASSILVGFTTYWLWKRMLSRPSPVHIQLRDESVVTSQRPELDLTF